MCAKNVFPGSRKVLNTAACALYEYPQGSSTREKRAKKEATGALEAALVRNDP